MRSPTLVTLYPPRYVEEVVTLYPPPSLTSHLSLLLFTHPGNPVCGGSCHPLPTSLPHVTLYPLKCHSCPPPPPMSHFTLPPPPPTSLVSLFTHLGMSSFCPGRQTSERMRARRPMRMPTFSGGSYSIVWLAAWRGGGGGGGRGRRRGGRGCEKGGEGGGGWGGARETRRGRYHAIQEGQVSCHGGRPGGAGTGIMPWREVYGKCARYYV